MENKGFLEKAGENLEEETTKSIIDNLDKMEDIDLTIWDMMVSEDIEVNSIGRTLDDLKNEE